MRIVMLGTGPFAVPTLRALADSSHEVLCAVSRPPRGRRAKPAPVTVAAEELQIETWLPDTVNSEASQQRLTGFDADLLAVCDYGEILKPPVLTTTRLGAINLHGSLLPKYRGAAPVQWAVFNGETETGNTVFQITPGLDAGPMLGVQRIAIDPDETSEQLEARMAELGAAIMLKVIDQLAAGTAEPIAQDKSQATKAPRLTKEMGEIDWSRSAAAIKNQVRALQPWPRASTNWLRAEGEPMRLILHKVSTAEGSGTPGEVLASDGRLHVATGDGAIVVEEILPAGKRAMPVADFLRGHAIPVGDRLG